MIIDVIENANKYVGLSDGFATALRYLQSDAWQDLPVGIHQIDGDNVYVQVQAYDSIPKADLQWEAHHKYCDIQYVVSGAEQMGYGKLADFAITVPYNDKNDVYFLEGQGQFTTVPAGAFTIFMPQDIHLPRAAIDDQPVPVKKLVFKIRV